MKAVTRTFRSMVCPPPMAILRIPYEASLPAPIRLISGAMMLSVNLVTSPVNAVPMTTATARSTMLPRARNSLKPFNPVSLSMLNLPLSDESVAHDGCGLPPLVCGV